MAWWIKVALAVVALALVYLVMRPKPDTGSSSARELVAEGALLLDVRTPGEFSEGHIEGATNIPVQELDSRLGELGAARDRPIVVYCRSGGRSSRAKALLEKAGFTAVHNLGAMSQW